MAITKVTNGLTGSEAANVLYNNDTELEAAITKRARLAGSFKSLYFSKNGSTITYDKTTKTLTTNGPVYVFNGSLGYLRLTAGSIDFAAAIAASPTSNFFYVYLNMPENWVTGTVSAAAIERSFSDLVVVPFASPDAPNVRADNALVIFEYNKPGDRVNTRFMTEDIMDIWKLLESVSPDAAGIAQTNKAISYTGGGDIAFNNTTKILNIPENAYMFSGANGGYVRINPGTVDFNAELAAYPSSNFFYVYADLASTPGSLKNFNKGDTVGGGMSVANVVVKSYNNPAINIRHPQNILIGFYDRSTGVFQSPFMVNKLYALLSTGNPDIEKIKTLLKLDFTTNGGFVYDKTTGTLTWSGNLYIFNNQFLDPGARYTRILPGTYDFKAAAEAAAPGQNWVTFYVKLPEAFILGTANANGAIPISPDDFIAVGWNQEGVRDIRALDSVVLFRYDRLTGSLTSPWFNAMTQLAVLDGGISQDSAALPWFNMFPAILDKTPNFLNKYTNVAGGTAEDKVLIQLWGDSIFARTQHTSAQDVVAANNPPALITKNFGAYLWQSLKGNKPEYYRYDAGSFSETGTWATVSDLANWDDAGDINTLTRRSTSSNAAVQATIPAASQYFNFIDRKDTEGATGVLVSIIGGDGKVQAREVGGSWVEANGFVFSQRNPAASSSGGIGNTQYQRRIEFKKVGATVGTEVNFVISKETANSDALMYWGLEIIPRNRPYLQLINVARGGHTFSQLRSYVQSDVYDRRPDLVVVEIPLINMYNSTPDLQAILNSVQDTIYGDRPGAANSLSLKSKSSNWADFEVLVVLPQYIRAYYTSDNKFIVNSAGYTAEEIWKSVKGFLMARGDVGVVDLAAAFTFAIDADPIYKGDYYSALRSSGVSGDGYLNDSIHQNNKGTAVWARTLCPIFSVPGR